jgi:hypothetical protein
MLRLLPVLLSAVLIAAHFLRSGDLLLVLLCLLWPGLLAVPRRWPVIAVQAFLCLAALEWVRTLLETVAMRRAAEEPWLRLVVVLGAVTLVTLASAWGLRGWRRPTDRSPPASPSRDHGQP